LFVLAGDGDERAALESQCAVLGLQERVLFLGYQQDVPNLLAHCDLFVLPSLYEGLPLAILEAMAAAKPVIATAVGGTGEVVVDGETGLLVPPGDPTALAGAIRKLLSDPPFARRLAAAGNVLVQRSFSTEAMVRRVSQVYEDLLARPGRQSGKLEP
jgi:glycosyltransferase involved in cell wall biosynthesis